MTPEAFLTGHAAAVREKPDADYKIDFDTGRIGGIVAGDDALRQSIRLRLLTERGAYPIYSEYYGLPFPAFARLKGDVCFIQIKNYITQTLLQDGRVANVDSFAFSLAGDGGIHVSFRVLTQSGELREEIEI